MVHLNEPLIKKGKSNFYSKNLKVESIWLRLFSSTFKWRFSKNFCDQGEEEQER